MCRHERVPLLRMLVLSGRRPLRPAECCVHGNRARLIRQSGATQSSSIAGPEGAAPFGLFAFQGVCMITKLSALLVLLLALVVWPLRAAAPTAPIGGLWDATV